MYYVVVVIVNKQYGLDLVSEQQKQNKKVKNCYTDIFLLINISYRPQVASSMFFQYNSALGPPYHVLVDTNFINFSIQNKLELVKAMMDCLYAKCKFFFLGGLL